MGKYFNKHIIIVLIIFILQSLNVAFCLSHPDVGKFVTYFAIIGDGFIFGTLVTMLINSK